MRTVAVIFALALITIAFEIYSDAVLTRSLSRRRPAPLRRVKPAQRRPLWPNTLKRNSDCEAMPRNLPRWAV
jgi:hypothetical protein